MFFYGYYYHVKGEMLLSYFGLFMESQNKNRIITLFSMKDMMSSSLILFPAFRTTHAIGISPASSSGYLYSCFQFNLNNTCINSRAKQIRVGKIAKYSTHDVTATSLISG